MNRGIEVLQTFALPLGYVAVLARVAGFEPAHDGIRIRCLTAWRYPNVIIKLMGWMVGFEPTYTGATTLGLNHLTTPTIKNGDPNRARTGDLQRDRLAF